jgi:hypothetical protein
LNGVSISNKNVPMEASISLHQRDHDRPAYSFSPVFGMDNQMRIIDDQKTVWNRVSQAALCPNFRKFPGASPRPAGRVAHLCVDALFSAEDPLLAPGNPVKV